MEGGAGAPLTAEEVTILDQVYEEVAPFIRPEGREAIEAQGTSIVDQDGEPVTPLVKGKECAYTTFDEAGKAFCGIEQAWKDGATQFRKPISCHLYPIRVQSYPSFDAVNYHKWQICSPACSLGKELEISVFEFTKEALRRKFGDDWISEVEAVAREWKK